MRQTMEYRGIVALAEADDESRAGGKAAGLCRLIRLGVPVPAGVVIPTTDVSAFGPDDIPLAIWSRILDARRTLQASTVIVRSSAVGEDSHDASFAGQLDSIGDVQTDAELRGAVLKCAASAHSDRVVAYERWRERRLRGLAIIIQEQIDSRISGVLFTVDPRGGGGPMIEYCAGAGEALVSGRVNPGRVAIDADGRPHHVATVRDARLDDRTIEQLISLGRRIEKNLQAPQDIEWTIDRSGACWIVQARPITTKAKSGTEARSVLWSNANVNENFPDPISPLLYSVAAEGYYHYFKNLGQAFGVSRSALASIDEPLRQIIGVHHGRMYYNLTNIHAVLRAAPFGEQLAVAFNQFIGTNEVTPRARRLDPRPWFAAARIAVSVAWQYMFLEGRVAEFERTVDGFAASAHPSQLPRLGREGLLQRLRAFREIRCHRWKNASLADAAAMVCYAALKILLRRSLPAEDQEALHNTLLKALPDLVSGRPAVELWKLSRTIRSNQRLANLFATASPETAIAAIRREPAYAAFRRDFDAYLDAWGFRCSAELMLTVPSFQERASSLVPLLRAYAKSDGESPEDQLTRQRAERLRETGRVQRALGPRAVIFRVLLLWTQRSIQLRERARLKQALLYSRLRRLALAIGSELVSSGQLDTPDEVFMLTADEIEQLLAGASMFPESARAIAKVRWSAHRTFDEVRPPDSLVLPFGAHYLNAATEPVHASDSPRALTGTSACGGRSTGRATVLADVSEAHRLAPGDILVTRQTDPGWGPVFPLISGLVMERGGMLSHGAIIAREFGIPSIVGVNDATRLIPSGSLVCLDGDRGTVRLVSEEVA